ncbi:hypothetical protein I553_9721 [Mycobacterium xenopi 4042]|uniref:Uncharacterized protein n=1 Tax=Mycobacterium xenopi 4042 TaxID=1299334 RepID=X7YQI6_MYCXE|nr:hypothetical protein I553_9721 [Mycobacterium xenopi 4042]
MGYAAAASTIDLRQLVPGALIPKDRFWLHTPKVWLFDVAMLAGLSVCYAGLSGGKSGCTGRDRVTSSTTPNTRPLTSSPTPTPIRRASCGQSTSTRCGRGGFIWRGPPPAGPSSTTSNPGCCRRLACAPTFFTSTRPRTRPRLLSGRRRVHARSDGVALRRPLP